MDRKRIGVITVGLMMCAGAALWAQTKTDETGGSLAALTAEVRLLRVAVEDGTKRQAEVQALAVSLSAQQSRMVQLSARIDAVRTEIASTEQRAKQSAFFLGSAQKEAAESTNPDERKQATEMLALFRQGADEAAAAMDNLRRREADFQSSLRIEEQRWADLISRLEQSIRK
jgi:hypothetical protein